MSDSAQARTKWECAQDDIPGPRGWIQWKGTDACIDLHCVCGRHDHFDGVDFCYYWRCVDCGRHYSVGSNVRLHELPPEFVDDEINFYEGV